MRELTEKKELCCRKLVRVAGMSLLSLSVGLVCVKQHPVRGDRSYGCPKQYSADSSAINKKDSFAVPKVMGPGEVAVVFVFASAQGWVPGRVFDV